MATRNTQIQVDLAELFSDHTEILIDTTHEAVMDLLTNLNRQIEIYGGSKAREVYDSLKRDLEATYKKANKDDTILAKKLCNDGVEVLALRKLIYGEKIPIILDPKFLDDPK